MHKGEVQGKQSWSAIMRFVFHLRTELLRAYCCIVTGEWWVKNSTELNFYEVEKKKNKHCTVRKVTKEITMDCIAAERVCFVQTNNT